LYKLNCSQALHRILYICNLYGTLVFVRYRRAEALGDKISVFTHSDSDGRGRTSFTKAFFNPK